MQQTISMSHLHIIRGGVEDTRLEAKAKDTPSEDRHSRGQGQKCLRAKDTGASVRQKRKRSSKFFSGDLKTKSLQKFFSGEKGPKEFFSGNLQLGKQEKVFANFLQGFWRAPTKF